jgi:hypothetical protein
MATSKMKRPKITKDGIITLLLFAIAGYTGAIYRYADSNSDPLPLMILLVIVAITVILSNLADS